MHMYKTLSEMEVPVPRVYVADVDGRVLGRPFLLIQKLEDERLRSLIKSSAGGDVIQAQPPVFTDYIQSTIIVQTLECPGKCLEMKSQKLGY